MTETPSKGNGILLLALCLNLALTLLSVGFLSYSVYTLGLRVKTLERNDSQPAPQGTERKLDRNARSVKQAQSGEVCQQCRESCVKLFGSSLIKVSI